jgi:hypothetical protein
MKELHCILILVSYFMIRQLKHEIPMKNPFFFHKNDNINSYLNPHIDASVSAARSAKKRQQIPI